MIIGIICPICGLETYEVSLLQIPASATEPAEHLTYDECIVCFWSNKPVAVEEIPF